MLTVEPIPAFNDNYLWLLHDGRCAAIVDPGDAAPVARVLGERGLTLTDILVTHHHSDHLGGVTELARQYKPRVYGPARERIPARDVALQEGDHVTALGTGFEVLEVPGHTNGHIAYYSPALGSVFCGDTMFAGGCGRLFEGTPEQMVESLAKLAALPEDTRVYCAHEYTLANLRFARAVEPDNAALLAREEHCRELRARNVPTVPSTIGDERATNPFVRCDEPAVRAAAERIEPGSGASRTATFAVIRAWKNRF
jgi:hydroxyacylglutathione hydrolase